MSRDDDEGFPPARNIMERVSPPRWFGMASTWENRFETASTCSIKHRGFTLLAVACVNSKKKS
jgi:hypothetical protein